jgi:hypothetical protein
VGAVLGFGSTETVKIKRVRPLRRYIAVAVIVAVAVIGVPKALAWWQAPGGNGKVETPPPVASWQYVVETGTFPTKAEATRHTEGLQGDFHFNRAGVMPCDEYRANDHRGLSAHQWMSTVGPWPHTAQGRAAAQAAVRKLGHGAVLRAVQHR